MSYYDQLSGGSSEDSGYSWWAYMNPLTVGAALGESMYRPIVASPSAQAVRRDVLEVVGEPAVRVAERGVAVMERGVPDVARGLTDVGRGLALTALVGGIGLFVAWRVLK